MNKFKIDRDLFTLLPVRIKQELMKSKFLLSGKRAIVFEVHPDTPVRKYNLVSLEVGEAYSIKGIAIMPIQSKAGRIKKETGKVFTVNQKLGIVLRIS